MLVTSAHQMVPTRVVTVVVSWSLINGLPPSLESLLKQCRQPCLSSEPLFTSLPAQLRILTGSLETKTPIGGLPWGEVASRRHCKEPHSKSGFSQLKDQHLYKMMPNNCLSILHVLDTWRKEVSNGFSTTQPWRRPWRSLRAPSGFRWESYSSSIDLLPSFWRS